MSALRDAAARCLSTHVSCRIAPPAGVLGCSCSRPDGGRLLTMGRTMATSAEKRKMQRLSIKKIDPNILEEEETLLRSVERRAKNTTTGEQQGARPSSDSSHPFFFLVVFPLLLTSLVILTREDLREELDQKGFVKLISDWRRGPQSLDSTYQQQRPQPIDVRQEENPP